MAVRQKFLDSYKCSLSFEFSKRFSAGKKYENDIVSKILALGISPEKIKRNVIIDRGQDADIVIEDRIGIEVKLRRGYGGYWDVRNNRLIYKAWLPYVSQPIQIKDYTYLIKKYPYPILILVSDAPVLPYSCYHFCKNRKDIYVSQDKDFPHLLRKLVFNC
jgi:hypothetical protein